MYTSM